MEQNKENLQQVNYPDLNNIPENPYTEDYHEYLVDPGVLQREVPKPKRIASIVLCAISNMIMLSFCVMWVVIVYMGLIRFAKDAGSSMSYSAVLFAYLLPGMLIPSIIAKILNRKSKWAIVNFVAMSVILVTIMIASMLMPTLLKDVKIKRLTDSWSREVDYTLKDYSFDVADIDEDYSHVEDDVFEVWIYVSTEADDDRIAEIDDFLIELRNMDDKDIYKMPIEVHPCYFDPDEDSNIVYAKSYKFDESTTSNKVKIERTLKEKLKDEEGEPDSVPEELEDGNLLIVVR